MQSRGELKIKVLITNTDSLWIVKKSLVIQCSLLDAWFANGDTFNNARVAAESRGQQIVLQPICYRYRIPNI